MTKTLRTSLLSAALGTATGLALVAGCGPKNSGDQPPPSNFNWSTGGGWGSASAPPGTAPGTAATGTPPPGTTTPPPGTTTPPATTTAPTTTAAPSATGTGTALPIDPTMVRKLLEPLQKQNAPGSKPVGDLLVGTVEQGKWLETNVVLEPSGTKCYTGIGVALPPVTDIVVELWANPPPPLPPGIIAQSQGSGAQVVMAGKPNCFKNLLPIPGPAKFRVTARAGGGAVAAQLYAK